MIRGLALILWLIPWALTAQLVPSGRAVEIAWSMMGGRQLSLKTQLVQDSVIPVGNPDLPAAFVVTFQPAGFVIVSAYAPNFQVLGYSLTSTFPTDQNHPLRSWLLPSYKTSTIKSVPSIGMQSSQSFTDQLVLPLISARWGQGDPWNRYCPADSLGNRALVGCVAVAMSQIMKKWEWPPIGIGQVTYTPAQHSKYGEITAVFDTTRYQWDLMHDYYPTDASALILFHCGAAAFMNYDRALSSTSVDQFAIPALINNFSYNRGMIFHDMAAYPLPDWIRMLHQELDNSRPVLYAGTSPDGKSSHAFDIDGYRNDTFFHFNWGWNGAGDGWYSLMGMAGGGADFSTQQGAIFGLQPAGIPLYDRPSSLDVLPGDGFVQLFWDQLIVAEFSNFNIYRDGVLIGKTADTSYRDAGLENKHDYTYKVTAFYEGKSPGESAPTPDITVYLSGRIEPGYSQTFETEHEGWQFQGSLTGFRVGLAANFQIGNNQGNIAAIRSEGHPAGEQVADYLISPVFYPGDFSHPAVSFDYVFKQNPGIDNLSLMSRDFTTGKWKAIAILDSTGGYSDWRNKHFYLPLNSGDSPIQIAFYYNDSYGQGFGAAIDNFTIYEVTEPAVPKLSIDDQELCINQSVVFTDQSEGSVQTWDWDFGEGAEPRFATTQGPHLVKYMKAGKKTVKLSLNHLDHLLIPDALTIRDTPVAAFNYYRRLQEISFVNKSDYAEQLLWLFGDGNTSTEADPIHTYYSKNLFEVKLIAYNGPCNPDTLTVVIDMRSGTGIDDVESLSGLTVFPNPTGGIVTIKMNNFPPEQLNIRILSTAGQVFLFKAYHHQKEIILDLNDFPDGLYILQITSGQMVRNEQILKINN
jgi:PKD repeat protein